MDQVVTITQIMALIKSYGPVGLVLVFLYLEIRNNRHQVDVYRDDMQAVLKEYGQTMDETRRMYENNVALVETTQDIGGDLREVVIMNTQAMQRLCDDIKHNQFCPSARVEKKKIEVAI